MMKIRIHRLGKIANAALVIRPLTILVGENNTNKTWTAYSAYALLRSLAGDSSRSHPQTLIRTRRLADQIKALASESASRIEATPARASINLEFSREQILGPIGSEVRLAIGHAELAKVLAAPPDLLKGASATLTVSRDELERGSKFFFVSVKSPGQQLMYAQGNNPLGFDPDRLLRLPESDLRTVMRQADVRQMTVTFTPGKPEDWTRRLSSLLFDFTLSSLGSVIALPAERKALVTLYKALSDEVAMQLPVPLRDFIERMQTAESLSQYRKSRESQGEKRGNTQLHSRLQQVLGGKLAIEESGDGGRITFSPVNGVSLPIQAASSMVRSLTGFAFAIEQFFKDANVLVIDEPEMNAHPTAQLAIVEMLAVLANRGNYIIATTHSPYILDHLNNLIAAGELPANSREKAAGKFGLKMSEAFLERDAVSAYEISPEGVVRNLIDAKRNRISTTTFGDVSNKLENLYSDLLEMMRR